MVSRSGSGDILMPRTRTWIVLGVLLSAPVLRAQSDSPQPAPQAAVPVAHHHRVHKAPAPVVLPPMPHGPLSQLPMDQIPATPAKVSYEGGLLSISAQNSSLGEILRDVRQLTGASIEIPQSQGANERVVTSLGPGAPRDVLAKLLNGSSFNYVMVGSTSDPAAVSSLILTPKPLGPGEPVQTAVNSNVYENGPAQVPPESRFVHPQPFNQQVLAQQQGAVAQPANAEAADADDKDDDADADDKDDDAAQVQPGQPGAPDPNAAQQAADPNQPNAGPKTPEQIMEMLRRSQQQPGSPVNQPPQQQPQQ